MSATTTGEAVQAPATASVEWSYNPWRERPRLALVAVLFAAGGCALVISFRESWVLTVGLAIAMVASLAPLFTPARCRVGDDDVARKGPFGWARRPWRDVRRARLTPGGLLVSPYAAPHWLDLHRALFLPLPSATREPLTTELQNRLSAHDLAR
jgi:hypothetical protein